MAINMKRYVDIASGVAGAGGVAQQKLVGRVFVASEMVPPGVVLSFGPGGAEEYFGGGGADNGLLDFARQYFSHVTPAPASQAKELQVCKYAQEALPAYLFGDFGSPVGLSQLKAITAGTLDITIDGLEYELSDIDLSGAVSIDAALGLVNSAISAAAGVNTKAELRYDGGTALYSAETLKTGAQGAFSIDGGTIGYLLELSSPRIECPGVNAQTPLEAFRAAEDVSDSFGSCYFLNFAYAEAASAVPLAEYVASKNVKYILFIDYISSEWSDLLKGTASTALVKHINQEQFHVSLPMALLAATDYSRRNASINYMFRSPGVTWTPSVTTDAEADQLDAAKVNYYGETATAGQKIAFFQRGVMCGPSSAPQTITVHANEQWFKAKIKADILSLFLSVGMLKANTDGKAAVLLALQDSIDAALYNGVIVKSKALTPAQQIVILNMTGDEEAWREVYLNGYWVDAAIVEETGASGVTEYICKYTLIYSKGDTINKIEGSHNLI